MVAELLFLWRLLHLLNSCWQTSQIQEIWKTVEVISLYMKRDSKEYRNCRGITLLKVVYKVYNRILSTQLKVTAETLIGEQQNVFRFRCPTIDNVFILQQSFVKKESI